MSPSGRNNENEVLATTPVLSPSPASSTTSSANDLKSMDNNNSNEAQNRSKGKSLKERSQVPASFALIAAIVFSLQYCSGLYQEETLIRWYDSMATSARFTAEYGQNAVELVQRAVVDGEMLEDKSEYAKLGLVFVFGFSLFYVFIWAPLRAGFWTGSRATKHVFHRYMGLAYLTQYFFAWVEFANNYENGGKTSVLPHFIALNGLAQGMSAFLSFKVLPELNDPGYYSDKAVLSRSFIHENIFFTLMCVFGTIYNYEPTRLALRTSAWGKFVEYIFVFWPFVAVRPFFPITRFKDAGKTRKGRSNMNERFYQVGTLMVKFFYLWAKYLLGFFTNFLLFLELVPKKHLRLLQGLFLLNLGTVSISIFLHTLRFRKVLPARFTFSIYLLQIYLTFSAIPLAYDMFSSHVTLVSVCMAGVACNMTRNRKMHAMWCLGAMLLLGNRDYQWLGRQIDW